MDAAKPSEIGQWVGGEVPVIRAKHQRVFDGQIKRCCAVAGAVGIPAPRLVAIIDRAEIREGQGSGGGVEHRVWRQGGVTGEVTEHVMHQRIIGLP